VELSVSVYQPQKSHIGQTLKKTFQFRMSGFLIMLI